MNAALDALRAALPGVAGEAFLAAAQLRSDASGATVLAVPDAFARTWLASRHLDTLDTWARSAGLGPVALVVDEHLVCPSSEEAERDAGVAERLAYQRSFPPGVVPKLLAERGLFSLSPSIEPVVVRDLVGSITIEPGRHGTPGSCEASVLTGLVSLWASGDRTSPVVETSLSRLAGQLGLAWSGQTARQLRDAIECLKTTTYRATLYQWSFPPGVVPKLLAERGLFSLTPTTEPVVVHDLAGSITIEPGRHGIPGVYEASVFTRRRRARSSTAMRPRAATTRRPSNAPVGAPPAPSRSR